MTTEATARYSAYIPAGPKGPRRLFAADLTAAQVRDLIATYGRDAFDIVQHW